MVIHIQVSRECQEKPSRGLTVSNIMRTCILDKRISLDVLLESIFINDSAKHISLLKYLEDKRRT